jgi:hypothetical protein
MRRSPIVAIIAGLLFGSSAALGAEVISGQPRIVDGDTVQIGTTKIRFAGIDAPETDQVCLDAKGERWACGINSRDELVRYSAGREWECDLTGIDKYGRSLGKCFVEGEDVSAWMVRSVGLCRSSATRTNTTAMRRRLGKPTPAFGRAHSLRRGIGVTGRSTISMTVSVASVVSKTKKADRTVW